MPLTLQVDATDPDPAVVREAAEMVRDGLVVAYPTDTLYGLAVDPRNAAAVRRLFALEGRPATSAATRSPRGPAESTSGARHDGCRGTARGAMVAWTADDRDPRAIGRRRRNA